MHEIQLEESNTSNSRWDGFFSCLQVGSSKRLILSQLSPRLLCLKQLMAKLEEQPMVSVLKFETIAWTVFIVWMSPARQWAAKENRSNQWATFSPSGESCVAHYLASCSFYLYSEEAASGNNKEAFLTSSWPYYIESHTQKQTTIRHYLATLTVVAAVAVELCWKKQLLAANYRCGDTCTTLQFIAPFDRLIGCSRSSESLNVVKLSEDEFSR